MMHKDNYLVCPFEQAGNMQYIVHAEDTLSRKERLASSA
jgi:hypothetical protein